MDESANCRNRLKKSKKNGAEGAAPFNKTGEDPPVGFNDYLRAVMGTNSRWVLPT
jgi:hypothetical protein